jgi:hypothetical protein
MMERIRTVHHVIEHVRLVTGEQIITVCHVRVIALFLGLNAYAILVF